MEAATCAGRADFSGAKVKAPESSLSGSVESGLPLLHCKPCPTPASQALGSPGS